jgi:hypothetical protein
MAKFTMDSTLGSLLADPKAKAVVDQYVPGVTNNPMVALVSGASLKALVAMPQAAQMGLTQAKVEALLVEVNKVV